MLGIDTLSNLEALTYAFTVMVCAIAEGFVATVRHPLRLAFIQGRIRISVVDYPSVGAVVPVTVESGSNGHTPAALIGGDSTNLQFGRLEVLQELHELPDTPRTGRAPDTAAGMPYRRVPAGDRGSADGQADSQADGEGSSGGGQVADSRVAAAVAAQSEDALPRWTAEFWPVDGERTFCVEHDVASFICGVSVADFATRVKWPCIAVTCIGPVTPLIVLFLMHWIRGGWGQYALAYPRPYWNDVWQCAGFWASLPVMLLWYGALQRDVAVLALKVRTRLCARRCVCMRA